MLSLDMKDLKLLGGSGLVKKKNLQAKIVT